MRGGRGILTATVACALALTPAVAFAEAPVAPVADEQAAEQAVATTVQVAVPEVGERSIYVVGRAAPLSATVTVVPEAGQDPAPIAGTIEFFDGETSLGQARVDDARPTATARLETDRWPAGGARQITAAFTPDEGSGLAASTSGARLYRVVDTARLVPDIELDGTAEAEISDASLEWTVANIWFSNFEVGFEREVLSGPVTLPEASNPGAGASIPEKQAYYFRPFTFSNGTGTLDGSGNRVISYEGAVRLTSGSANRWDFADPQVHVAANGDGYITAVFSGYYILGQQTFSYEPVRVTIATFSGAEIEPGTDGLVSAEIELNWEGQAMGAGTWAHDYDESFPTEFVSLLHPAINLFFARSSVATDGSKIPHPITLSFAEQSTDPGTPEPPEPKPLPYKDVKGTTHEAGIDWMYQQGYVAAAERFNPANPTTRGAFATMLMRMNEKSYTPKASLKLPYTDVKKSDIHYKGIAWMYERGYAAKADRFNAANPVTRGAMATFMQRMEAPKYTPKASLKLPYTDVQKSDTHYKGIAWMYENGNAASAAKYNAGNSTTRGAMSTFLYLIYR